MSENLLSGLCGLKFLGDLFLGGGDEYLRL